MVSRVTLCCLLTSLLVGHSWGNPVPLQSFPSSSDSHPLTLVSELTSRLGSHPTRLQDARLPIPTPQDLEAIKKVAQILIMLGQQVIPAIIGEPTGSLPAAAGCDQPQDDVPNDPVNIDRQT